MKKKQREINDGDRNLLAGLLTLLEPFGKPPLGGVLENEEGFYLAYYAPDWPIPIENDDSPLNDSIAVVRSFDLDFLKEHETGKVLQVRCIIAGLNGDLADEAERRMRALVSRARKDVRYKDYQL